MWFFFVLKRISFFFFPNSWVRKPRQENKDPVLVFSHAAPAGVPDGGSRELALAAVKRLKTLRHPRMLRFVDATTVGDTAYLVTERAAPLAAACARDPSLLSDGPLSWGLLQACEALAFLHTDCGLVHGGIGADAGSLWVTPGGDWRLGGFELAAATCADLLAIPRFRALPFLPADVSQCGSWPKHALDVACLGRAVAEVAGTRAAGRARAALDAMTRGPARGCPPAAQVAESAGLAGSAYAAMMKLIETMPVMPAEERVEVLRGLGGVVAGLPACVTRHKLLPGLVELVGIDPAGSAGAIPVIANAARSLPDEDFDTLIAPAVAKLAAANDRGVRVALLRAADPLLARLSEERCGTEVFPLLTNGFTDASPLLRELTLQALLYVTPNLPAKLVTTTVPKALAALGKDAEPGIRTNAVLCLAKLSPHFPRPQREGFLVGGLRQARL
jgi:SCY1-like protein 1